MKETIPKMKLSLYCLLFNTNINKRNKIYFAVRPFCNIIKLVKLTLNTHTNQTISFLI